MRKITERGVFDFSIRGRRFSGLKGALGRILATEFMVREYFRPSSFWRAVSPPFFLNSPSAADLKMTSQEFIKFRRSFEKEDPKRLLILLKALHGIYWPDVFLSIGGKLHVIEAKFGKGRLYPSQKQGLLIIGRLGYPAFLVHVNPVSFYDYKVELQKL
jgi:hypothetical protein